MTEQKQSESENFKESMTDAFKAYQEQNKAQALPDALLSFCKGPECFVSAMHRKQDKESFRIWASDQAKSLEAYFTNAKAKDPQEEASTVIKSLYRLLPNEHIKTWEAFVQSVLTFDPSKDFTSSLFGRRFPVGTISYIGARPARGKTTMLVNLAMDAIEKGKQVSFVTSEETTKQLIVRLILRQFFILAREKIPYEVDALLHSDEYKPRSEFYGGLKGNPYSNPYTGSIYHDATVAVAQLITSHQIEIFEAYGASWDEMVDYLRTLESGRVVLIDYIQHLKMPDRVATQTRQIQVQEASHVLADTAGQNGLICISGAQFNRPKDANENDEDTFTESSFREAGDIEQDGHILIGIGKNPRTGEFFYSCMKDREAQPDNGTKWALGAEFKFSYMQGVKGDNGKRLAYRSVREEPKTQPQEKPEQQSGRKLKRHIDFPHGRGLDIYED